jgi:hypothetical protein
MNVASSPKLFSVHVLEHKVMKRKNFAQAGGLALAPKAPSIGIAHGHMAVGHVAMTLHFEYPVGRSESL